VSIEKKHGAVFAILYRQLTDFPPWAQQTHVTNGQNIFTLNIIKKKQFVCKLKSAWNVLTTLVRLTTPRRKE